MREGWQEVKLGEVCDFKNGLWKGKKEPYVHVGVIRNTNFTKKGSLDHSDIAFLDVESKQYSTRKLQFGDIILEKSGGGPKQAVGRVVFFDKTDGEYSFSNFTSLVRVRNPKQIDSTYLHRLLYFFYLSGATEPMQKHSTGIRNLQLKEYKDLSIPLPPLPEQKRIVAILDETFEGIDRAVANTEKNLANARELFESYLNNVFTQKGDGWKTQILDEVCLKITDGSHYSPKTIGTGFPYITVKDIGKDNDLIDFENCKFIGENDYRDLVKNGCKPIVGDVLFSKDGTVGKVSLVDYDQDFVVLSSLAIIRPNSKIIDSKYLKYIFKAPFFLQQAIGKKTGVAIRRIVLKNLKTIPVPFPPLPEQKHIIEILDSLQAETQRLESIYQRKLTALAELKQSLLHKAFSGELTTDVSTKKEAVA